MIPKAMSSKGTAGCQSLQAKGAARETKAESSQALKADDLCRQREQHVTPEAESSQAELASWPPADCHPNIHAMSAMASVIQHSNAVPPGGLGTCSSTTEPAAAAPQLLHVSYGGTPRPAPPLASAYQELRLPSPLFSVNTSQGCQGYCVRCSLTWRLGHLLQLIPWGQSLQQQPHKALVLGSTGRPGVHEPQNLLRGWGHPRGQLVAIGHHHLLLVGGHLLGLVLLLLLLGLAEEGQLLLRLLLLGLPLGLRLPAGGNWKRSVGEWRLLCVPESLGWCVLTICKQPRQMPMLDNGRDTGMHSKALRCMQCGRLSAPGLWD